jgi:hypothetical protein
MPRCTPVTDVHLRMSELTARTTATGLQRPDYSDRTTATGLQRPDYSDRNSTSSTMIGPDDPRTSVAVVRNDGV